MFAIENPMFLHSDKKKKNPIQVKEFTLAELKSLSGHCLFVNRYGSLSNAKITSVKTWKTRPGDVDIHLKYGMYEYFIASWINGISSGEQLVKVIES